MTSNVEDSQSNVEEGPLLWVIVRSSNNLLAFDASIVGNMIAIPKITHVPDNVAYMSGTITVRGSIIPLVDLRIYTGQPSGDQELDDFCQLMDQRLSDHLHWIEELKLSVDEKRAFELATDPHKCAFGKWYDSYKTDNRMVASILLKFDAPHRVIHGIAEKVTRLVGEGRVDEAHELIDSTSNGELKVMIGLFDDIKTAMRESGHRRIAMVLENSDRIIALNIDEVVAVESIDQIEDAPQNQSGSMGITRIGRRKNNDELVLLMENVQF
ncbi:MAG: chemotaxis protein CheW [Geopsychrobacter sp.]|nr:chemotaxis protein CheW [Geopsychrobacter sp.]